MFILCWDEMLNTNVSLLDTWVGHAQRVSITPAHQLWPTGYRWTSGPVQDLLLSDHWFTTSTCGATADMPLRSARRLLSNCLTRVWPKTCYEKTKSNLKTEGSRYKFNYISVSDNTELQKKRLKGKQIEILLKSCASYIFLLRKNIWVSENWAQIWQLLKISIQTLLSTF